MCWTWGYGAFMNLAAIPVTCSVTVVWLPFSARLRVPEPLAWFSELNVAW
jgi:hypothetical protein